MPQTIGERIEVFAKAKFGSVNAMAEAIDMKGGNLSGYASGKNKPGTPVLERFRSIGMSIDWLLTGEGDMIAGKTSETGARGMILDLDQIPNDQIMFTAAEIMQMFAEELKKRG